MTNRTRALFIFEVVQLLELLTKFHPVLAVNLLLFAFILLFEVIKDPPVSVKKTVTPKGRRRKTVNQEFPEDL